MRMVPLASKHTLPDRYDFADKISEVNGAPVVQFDLDALFTNTIATLAIPTDAKTLGGSR
jgi:hypothetical protein